MRENTRDTRDQMNTSKSSRNCCMSFYQYLQLWKSTSAEQRPKSSPQTDSGPHQRLDSSSRTMHRTDSGPSQGQDSPSETGSQDEARTATALVTGFFQSMRTYMTFKILLLKEILPMLLYFLEKDQSVCRPQGQIHRQRKITRYLSVPYVPQAKRTWTRRGLGVFMPTAVAKKIEPPLLGLSLRKLS